MRSLTDEILTAQLAVTRRRSCRRKETAVREKPRRFRDLAVRTMSARDDHNNWWCWWRKKRKRKEISPSTAPDGERKKSCR